MAQNPIIHPRRVYWERRIHVLMLFALLVVLVPRASSRDGQLPTQPALLALAVQQPTAQVGVIVQKQGEGSSIERAVTRLGGIVTQDLQIINAFAARLPAKALPALARVPGVRWISLDATTQQSDAAASFTTWATRASSDTAPGESTGRAADSVQGPNGTYADVGAARLSFAGFSAEMTPGYAISKVELVLSAYVSDRLRGNERLVVGVTAAGTSGQTVSLGHRDVGALGGVGNAGALYLDITSTRRWQWADFDDSLTVTIDQQSLRKGGSIAYDALGLRVTSVPGVDTSGGVQPTALPRGAVDASRLQTNYHRAVRAPDVWNQAPTYLQGQGMTVAVVDSGFIKNRDLGGRLLARVNFEKSSHKSEDRYGHGTHVISILAGSGLDSRGQYMGIAPKANVISLRIANDEGMSTESDVVAALQWIYENRTRYNIRVVNLSLNSSEAQSYHTSPLNAAVEVLWFSGIVVVVSAGNNGSGANSAHLYPPANDPFVITVGATDDRGTPQLADDVVAPFSASGTTPDGLAKPELVAPGANIVAYLPENNRLKISRDHPGHRISTDYFRMSGTSMAAPMVSAAAVLLLQDEPGLTPDQVKYRLMATAARAESWPGYDAPRAGAGYLDVYAAVNGSTTESANSGATPSQLLWSDGTPPAWGSVHWGSVHWGSVHWGSVHWGSDYWGE